MAQQSRDGYFNSNISLRKTFKNGRWAVGAAYHNLFNTVKYNTTYEGDGFFINEYLTSKPYASFSLTYNFNNQK